MEVIVTIAGRTERVRLERRDDGSFDVSVGERSYQLGRQQLGSLHSLIDDSGLQREISPRSLGLGRWSVATRDGVFEAEVADPLTHLAESSGAAAGGRRRQRVSAYMPGRVVAVLVEVGAEVSAGQSLLVLEAMKMQNEILAEAAGTVSAIHVEPGRTVESGDPLFDIE